MTGYVHHMVDKKQTFPEFAMSCARAFGALIEMRDEGMDTKIPDEIKPEPYHKEHAEQVRKDLAAFQAMTDEARLAWAEGEKRDRIKELRKGNKEEEATAAKLVAMLAKVEAWRPPTKDHEGMKKFMLEQLRTSMPAFDYYNESLARILVTDAESMILERFASLKRDIKYHDQHYAEEVKRAKERTDWVKQLRESL